jgi:hypothetical protein
MLKRLSSKQNLEDKKKKNSNALSVLLNKSGPESISVLKRRNVERAEIRNIREKLILQVALSTACCK